MNIFMRSGLFVSLLFCAFSGFAQIGHRSLSFPDPERNNRNVSFELYYPAEVSGDDTAPLPGEYPVVVLGHGFVMVTEVYSYLWEALVPQGYVMALATTEGGFAPSHQDFGLDLRFIASRLQEESQSPQSDFYTLFSGINGVIGHSMGGGSAVLAAAQDGGVFSAYIGLAPAETTPSAVGAGASVNIPAMVLSGDADAVTPPQDHHIPIYNALASDCKLFVNFENGSHCYFATSGSLCDLGEFFPGSLSRSEQLTGTANLVKAFFDITLKAEASAVDVLLSEIESTPWMLPNQSCDFNSLSTGFLPSPQLIAYPNPFRDEILLSGGPIENLALSSLNGSKIPLKSVVLEGHIRIEPLNTLAPGIYILSGESRGQAFSMRMVKEE